MTKKLFFSLAGAALLASCSDDLQLVEQGQISSVDGINGKLVKAGFLTGARDNDETRAVTPTGKFVWMSDSINYADGKVIGDNYPKIGLCWTGVDPITGNDTKSYGAIDEPEVNVFTNYLYEQKGWMQMNQSKLDWDECSGDVFNAAFYVGSGKDPVANYTGTYATNSSYNGVKSTRGNKYYYGNAVGQFGTPGKDLNLGVGVFSTENSSVFQGQYIVYFPYNGSFKKGPIIANSKDHFTVDVNDDVYATYSSNAFQLGLIDDYSGIESGEGKEAPFTSMNYSAVAKIHLYHSNIGTKKVKSVILYSAKNGITYEAGVNAKSVVEAIKAEDLKNVAQVDGTKKHTHAIYADLIDKSATPANEYATVSNTKSLDVALPVLPQENISDLEVIVVFDDYKTKIYNFANTKFDANVAKTFNIDLDVTSSANYIAYDEPSLVAVLEQIKNTGGSVRLLRPIDLEKGNSDLYAVNNNPDPSDPDSHADAATINYGASITINADAECQNPDKCESAYITVKSETTRTIESTNASATFTINVPVIVEGLGCCANTPAVLNLGGTDDSKLDKIKLTKTLTNYGTTNVGNTTGVSDVVLSEVKNLRDTKYVTEQISKNGKKYTKGSFDRFDHPAGAAQLNFLAPAIPTGSVPQYTKTDNIENEGSILFSAAGEFTTGNWEGNRANWTTVSSIKNTGFLIKDKSIATDELNLAGGDIVVDKYAYVIVEGTIANENKWSYIHTIGSGYSTSTDGRLDVNTSNGSVNKGTINNYGVINLLGGNLNNEEGLLIDRLNGQVGGNKVNNGTAYGANATNDTDNHANGGYNTLYFRGVEKDGFQYKTDLFPGIYCTEVGTLARLSKVLTDVVQKGSCVVIDIVKNNGGAGYDLKNFTEAQINTLASKDVRFSVATKLMCSNQNSGKYCNYTRANNDLCIGHCIDVQENVTLDKADYYRVVNNALVRKNKTLDMTTNVAQLKIGYNLYVYDYATVKSVALAGTTVSTTGDINVGNDMNVKANGKVYASTSTDIHVGHDVNNAGDVDADKKLIVGHDVNNSGTVEVLKQFTIGNDYIGAAGSNLDSDGDNNVVTNDFKLSGDAQFAANTSTDIKNTFYSLNANSVFTREQLGTDTNSRSTVNCKHLDHNLQGHAVGGWPTEYVEF